MNYTIEDKKQIRKNIEAIKEYLIKNAHTVGESFEFKWQGNYKYSLRLKNYSEIIIDGWIGLNCFISWDDAPARGEKSVFDELDYCITLLENWQILKARINEEAENAKRKRELIYNFKI